MRDVSNGADILDSRDIIARIRELEDARDSAAEGARELETEIADLEARDERTIGDADDEQCKRDALWTDEDGAVYQESSDWTEEDANELRALLSLQEQAEGYSDWNHGAALIRDSYFEDYARECAEDMHGRALRDASWPFDCIDWSRAADELQTDYTSVDFDGVTYWIR